MDVEKFIEVGEFYQELNDVIGSNMPLQKIYRSKCFSAHLINKKHFNCLKHIDSISNIIENPDYIGVNLNEHGETIKLIKILNKNILVGIKLNSNENYLYVSTMHDIKESKINKRLHNGRIKKL